MWTAGLVADYVGQVSDDRSSAFGPAQLTFWALDEVSANASGGTPQLFRGPTITKGVSAFAQLSYRPWAPDARVSPPKSPIHYK
jgi:hypothetical protein